MQIMDQPLKLFARGKAAEIPFIIVSYCVLSAWNKPWLLVTHFFSNFECNKRLELVKIIACVSHCFISLYTCREQLLKNVCFLFMKDFPNPCL